MGRGFTRIHADFFNFIGVYPRPIKADQEATLMSDAAWHPYAGRRTMAIFEWDADTLDWPSRAGLHLRAVQV
jgi:hypothetical protein